MKKTVIILIALVFIAGSCKQSPKKQTPEKQTVTNAGDTLTLTHEKYDYLLNTIEAIKYFEPTGRQYAYHSIQLTPTEYWQTPFSQTLIAKAIYKGEIIGIKIERTRAESEKMFDEIIFFKSIGKESDNFVKAIAELYEENANENTVMRSEIAVEAYNSDFTPWNLAEDWYKARAIALNGREAFMYLNIMIPKQIVTIDDKNRGLSKKRFVDVFRANEK